MSSPSPLVLVYDITVAGFELVLPLPYGTITSINWGDGNTTTDGSKNHTYTNSGAYTVSVLGNDITHFNYFSYGTGNQYLTGCTSFGEIGLTNLYSAFFEARNLTTVPTSLPTSSNVTNMNKMFEEANNFNQDISGWDVSNVTDMSEMFRRAPLFNQDIGGWNVSNVTNMRSMFNQDFAFNQDISSWNVSNVTNMNGMFSSVTAFNQPIGSWNVSNVTNMNGMFSGATAFNQNISSWDVSKVTDMDYMLSYTDAFNQDISSWDISSVTNMTSMFENATAFSKQAPYILDNILNSWSALTVQSGVTFDAPQAYYSSTGQSGYDALVAKGWTINSQLFVPTPLVLVYDITVSGFELVLPLPYGTITSVNWGDGTTNTSKRHTYADTGTYTVSVLGTGVTTFNYWDFGGTGAQYLIECNSFGEIGLTDLTFAFAYANNLTTVPTRLPVNSSVTNMAAMFNGAATTFNQDISSWDVSTVTNMSSMFNSTAFNQPIGSWNVSNVTDMSYMFSYTTTFNQDISSWNVSNVTTMTGMFLLSTAFNQDISNWNISNVTDMGNMFNGATAFSPDEWITNLDKLLNAWSTLDVHSGIVIDALQAIYNQNGQAGYDALVAKGWSIDATYLYHFPCFLEGSKILCYIDGQETYAPIETIRKGTLVKTRLNGYIPVDMIGRSKMYNPGHSLHSKSRLYKLSPNRYPNLTEDLVLTGCHSVLVDELTEEQREKSIAYTGDIYITDDKYRLIACLDHRAQPYTEEGVHTIWHLALENENYYWNYGIYANGLLVETTSKRTMKELSGMELIE